MTSSLQINWLNYGQYKITDVHGKQHDQVQQFMLEHFRSYRLFRVLNIQQEAGIENEFLKIVKHILENESSLIVVDNDLNDIKGVALLKCMTQESRSWTALQLLIENERFRQLCDMVRWCLQQQAIQHKDNPGGDSLHIFSLHLCKELEEDTDFLANIFNVICEVARHVHMPRVTCMCLSRSEHECMRSAGFNEMVRVIYSMYVFKNRRPFDRLRDINEMYGVFYEKHVQALVPYHEMLIRHAKPVETKEAPRISRKTMKEEEVDAQK